MQVTDTTEIHLNLGTVRMHGAPFTYILRLGWEELVTEALLPPGTPFTHHIDNLRHPTICRYDFESSKTDYEHTAPSLRSPSTHRPHVPPRADVSHRPPLPGVTLESRVHLPPFLLTLMFRDPDTVSVPVVSSRFPSSAVPGGTYCARFLRGPATLSVSPPSPRSAGSPPLASYKSAPAAPSSGRAWPPGRRTAGRCWSPGLARQG